MKRQFRSSLAILAAALIVTAAHAQSGADTYKSKCAMCHAADGTASTPAGKAMKARPFDSPDVLKESDADLIAIVKNGKGKMPAYAGKLADGQIKEVVAFIHTLQKK